VNDWTDRALCAEISGDFFYPEKGDGVAAARAVCRSCEVRLPCLEYSIEIADWNGIYGGFTERARQRIARQVRAGKPLEDIIAEDDAEYYARLEKSAGLAKAAARRHRARARYAEAVRECEEVAS